MVRFDDRCFVSFSSQTHIFIAGAGRVVDMERGICHLMDVIFHCNYVNPLSNGIFMDVVFVSGISDLCFSSHISQSINY